MDDARPRDQRCDAGVRELWGALSKFMESTESRFDVLRSVSAAALALVDENTDPAMAALLAALDAGLAPDLLPRPRGGDGRAWSQRAMLHTCDEYRPG